jgi:hypothetical protein
MLNSEEQHYARSMSRAMVMLWGCPTGSFIVPHELLTALAERTDSTPARITLINRAIGAEVAKVIHKPTDNIADAEVSRIVNKVVDEWQADRSDDHRTSCRAIGELLVEDGLAINRRNQ